MEITIYVSDIACFNWKSEYNTWVFAMIARITNTQHFAKWFYTMLREPHSVLEEHGDQRWERKNRKLRLDLRTVESGQVGKAVFKTILIAVTA